jgi:CO/xanthine dehydrogenase FAD-binding subunit
LSSFEYLRPASLGEAVVLLAESSGGARPLAGGTDLLVQLRAERYELDRVVDVKAVPELNVLRYDVSDGLTLGAAVPCCSVYEYAELKAAYPGVVDAVSLVGGIAIQSRASVGGNLCNGSPSADTIPSLIVHEAICTIAGPSGTRTVSVGQFCTAPGVSVMEPGELLVSLHLPPPRARTGSCYLRFIPRNEMDIAVVGVGAWVELAEDGQTILGARLALGAVAPTPIEVPNASRILAGTDGSDSTLATLADAAQAVAQPITDMRGSAVQRRHLVGVLTHRAVRGALQRARGEQV